MPASQASRLAPATGRPTLLPVSDRLQDLRRQRALVQQHLAWLDTEIAAAESPAGTLPSGHPIPVDTAPSAAATPEEAEALALARAEAVNAPAQAKLGCWIVFAGAFVLLFAAIAVWFVARYGIGAGP